MKSATNPIPPKFNNSTNKKRMEDLIAKKIAETTCADCPFATHIDTNRYRCEEIHRIGLEVVRGHWKTSTDCLLPLTKKYEEIK